ncbi:MAG: PAS domain S-box protein, partial [Chloroflexi bacterium]|nr:PAS domain S-box protein [Chloroflexota bacterium]
AAYRAQPPDCLVLSAALPAQASGDVLRTIRAADFSTPIVRLTASSHPEEQSEALKRGLDDVVASPLDLDALVFRVRQRVLGYQEFTKSAAMREAVQARLAALIASSADAIIGETLDGIITDWNAGAEQLFSYQAAEVIDRSFAVIVPPERAAEQAELLARVRGGEAVSQHETVRRRKDGQLIEVSVSLSPIYSAKGQLVGVSTIARDMSERTRAERVLRESEAKLRSVWEAAADAMAVSDAEGIVVDANPAYYALYGLTPEQVIGHHFAQMFPLDRRALAIAQHAAVFAGAPGQGTFESTVRRADGTEGWVQSRASLLVADGRPAAKLCVIRDMTEQRRAEAALRGSESRFRSLIEQSSDAIALSDVNGVLTFVSPATTRILGYSVEQLVGTHINELIHPDDAERLRQKGSVLLQPPSGHFVAEFRARHADGTWRWFEGTVTNLLHEPSVQAVVTNYRDVTARKQMEEALHASATQYQELFDDAPVGYHELDAEGRITRVNRADCELLGATEADLLGKYIWEFIDEAEQEVSRQAMAAQAATAIPLRVAERIFRRRDGTRLDAVIRTRLLQDKQGRVSGFRTTVDDVTERNQVTTALQESERRLRAIVGSLDGIVLEFDGEGTYLNVWTNDGSLLAQPKDTMLGRRVTDVLGEELGQPYLEAFRRVLQTGQPEVIEYSLEVGADRRSFLGSINAVRWPDGAFRTVSLMARDITERKNLEEQLRQAQKMEALGQLTGGIAHDFNNLLTVVTGYAELLLLRDNSLAPESRAMVAEIGASGQRAAALTLQLLAFSRRQVLDPKVLELNTVVAELSKLLHRLIGEDIDLVAVPASRASARPSASGARPWSTASSPSSPRANGIRSLPCPPAEPLIVPSPLAATTDNESAVGQPFQSIKYPASGCLPRSPVAHIARYRSVICAANRPIAARRPPTMRTSPSGVFSTSQN